MTCLTRYIGRDSIPSDVKDILIRLNQYGFSSYVCGGAVRDLLMKKSPSDWDITTSATPDEIEFLFPFSSPTGKRYGTITVHSDSFSVEVTTFRSENGYTDGRRPDVVKFAKTVTEDVSRRDFTINGLLLSPSGVVYDFVGGLHDIDHKIIRAIGDPSVRFKEDKLRMMRAVRFSTTLGFTIESSTQDAICENSAELACCSPEIIVYEFNKILCSLNVVKGLTLLYRTGLLKVFLPEVSSMYRYDQKNPHHSKTLFYHTLSTVDNVHGGLEVKLAALLHDVGKPLCQTFDDKGVAHYYNHHKVGSKLAKDILTRLRYPTAIIEVVRKLIYDHMAFHLKIGSPGIKRVIGRVGKENIYHLLDLFFADGISSSPPFNKHFEKYVFVHNEVHAIFEKKQVFEKKQLAISGKDIIELGVKPGIAIGEILKKLLEDVIINPELNNKESLIELAKKIISNQRDM